MGSNLENDRSLNSGKMYPIDLAPQKITIVKNVSNTEMKMAHLLPGQSKPPGTSQIITHSGPLSGPLSLMRPGTQLISSGVASQPQMIVSGSPILQGTQIVSQGTQAQLIGSSSQMISQSQLISPQLMSPGTQIISQGTQLSVSNSIGVSISTAQTQVTSQPQVLSVGSQLVSGSGNIVMGSSVRTLPPSVRVLPPLPHHNTRPMLSSVNVTSAPSSAPVSSHVPRGLAAGASLAVRPVAPQGQASQGWGGSQRGRTALVYGARSSAPAPTPAPALTPAPAPAPLLSLNTHTNALTLTTANVLTSNSVISGAIRNVAPRAATPPAPRPLPLLQRNYQPAKVVGVASVGVRSIVGNSAPTQLYYEVPRAAAPSAVPPRPTTPYHSQVSIVNSTSTQSERPPAAPAQAAPAPPRPTILRKRDQESSPTKGQQYRSGWEDVPVGGASGGSTTISAASSPEPDLSPRKKPRKQLLNSEVRQCDIPVDESPPTPPAPPPPPKRPQLSSSYVCGWRSTALHFIRPSDVKRREPKHRDIFSIANTKHALTSAQGWKVHALTAQMEDLVSLESDVGAQLANVLRALETQSSKSQSYTHNALELIKGNIQRSKIVCEGIQEAREDILRVFTHRGFVSDILTRQADKRCFRKHRSQS